MMWLIIILFLGVIITLLESALESIIVWLEKRGMIKTSSTEWFGNGTLQLQRMAHEELGLGDWSGCTGPSVIPVTEKGQLLGVYNLRDANHPKLVTHLAPSDELDTDKKPGKASLQGARTEGLLTETEQDYTDDLESSIQNDSPSSSTQQEDNFERRNSSPDSGDTPGTSSEAPTAVAHAQSAEKRSLAPQEQQKSVKTLAQSTELQSLTSQRSSVVEHHQPNMSQSSQYPGTQQKCEADNNGH